MPANPAGIPIFCGYSTSTAQTGFCCAFKIEGYLPGYCTLIGSFF